MAQSLKDKVALVAGATRGAGRGIAVQLGAAGATVYCTGRTTRAQRSEMNRPETIEETAALVDAGGRPRHRGAGRPPRARRRCARSSTRIEREQGALAHSGERHLGRHHGWSGTRRSGSRPWKTGCALLASRVDTHAITSHFALPLLIQQPGGLVVEVNDGTDEYNATHYRVSFFYDLPRPR